MSVEFLMTSFILVVSPGTGVLYTLVTGLSRMLELSGVFMLMTLAVFVAYGLFAASVRDHIVSQPRVLTWLRRSFAAAFVGLGAKLAFTNR